MVTITDVGATYVLVLLLFRAPMGDIPWTHTFVLRYSLVAVATLLLIHGAFGTISDEYYYGLEIFSIFNTISAYIMILQGKTYQDEDLTEKVAIVTGANAGIGLEIARQLAQMGAHVIFACRSKERAEDAMKQVAATTSSSKLEFMALDVGSLASVRAFAAEFLKSGRTLHILINNAGVNHYRRHETVDGFEAMLGTNFLGPFLLTNLLLPALLRADDGRVVNVGSCVMKWATKIPFEDLNTKHDYGTGQGVYNWTKWANYLFSQELHRRYADTTLTNMHPFLNTLAHWFNWLRPFLQQTGEQGAYTPVFAATCRHLTGGHYLARSEIEELPARFVDADLAKRLWDVACPLVGLPKDYFPTPTFD
ncbi:hypothetical protein SPRG_06996 [Saprolegnia parasitica CBS 223.65]|uniref:Uncharacterized protein n=1 Tax=Saprolegnia parasitica (strain CBS 223.65) TaxID=695850 RepID=A0A067C9G0_SAPPC|nr:hypothetical protein SPRG_06996 [Saprolegnia parasitica CBS 223.65]KDO27409.1 hypothetical protein SPRG_06996 [Saprolegnia parasitica CBS 223.65]|eukprot:XP_012201849.1 hypothetical protein SPRG_06996 [Saprolegnia parasitica CBS 223.65]